MDIVMQSESGVVTEVNENPKLLKLRKDKERVIKKIEAI
jgi:hypothetical protein